MVRGAKTPMEFIKDRKARVSTFLTRRKGLEKKSHELSILCGVQVGLIIFAPEDISSTKINKKESLLYPKDHEEVNNIIHSFLASDPIERKRRSTDLSGFYLDKTKKAREELIKVKLKKDNIESLYPTWDQTYNNLSAEQLRHLADQLETNIQAAKARLEFMKRARNLGLTACGSNMNLYEGGRLALTGNDQLSTWPAPNMLGWNSMEADVIQPHEISSHQGGVLCLPPFENVMEDNRMSMWTREDASSSNAKYYVQYYGFGG